MGAPTSASQPLPNLTKVGIQRLIARLDSDWSQVKKSQAPDSLKQNINFRIAQLKINLRVALGSASPDFAVWLTDMRPLFADLSNLLKQAQSTPSTGACFYQGGCLDTTAAQCQELGGNFEPGAACP